MSLSPTEAQTAPLKHLVLSAGLREAGVWKPESLFSIIEVAVEIGCHELTIAVYPPDQTPDVEAINQCHFAELRAGLHEPKALARLARSEVYISVYDPQRRESEMPQAVQRDQARLTVHLLLDYDGRTELIRALQALQGTAPNELTCEMLEARLSPVFVNEPDLIVFTGGERRLLNLLTWQASYSEYLFIETPWQEIDGAVVQAVVDEFQKRQRRFGKG